MTTVTPSLSLPAGSVVVGVDGSPGAEQALDWAIDQATLERRPLTLVSSTQTATGGNGLWLEQPGLDLSQLLGEVEAAGRDLLDQAERRALHRAPDLVVGQVLSSADPRSCLADLSARAALVVVGSRGRGPIRSLLLGSVGAYVAQHSECPVVVVRHAEAARPHGGVVVDVDGTEESRHAIEFAYRAASYRALPLTALRVVRGPRHRGNEPQVVADDDTDSDEERLLLSEATAGMREKFPDVDDRLTLMRGLREVVLTQASREADLLVLGQHHQGPLDRLLRGSTAAVVEQAECAVAVMPTGVTTTR